MDQTHLPPHFRATGAARNIAHQQHRAGTSAHLSNNRQGKDIVVKRTLKYLNICKNPKAYRSVLQGSSDDVIKALCNAALNVEQGDIDLTPQQQQLYAAHRTQIAKLTSRAIDLRRKRGVIGSQTGGFPFIPILIGTALGALGGKLFGG